MACLEWTHSSLKHRYLILIPQEQCSCCKWINGGIVLWRDSGQTCSTGHGTLQQARTPAHGDGGALVKRLHEKAAVHTHICIYLCHMRMLRILWYLHFCRKANESQHRFTTTQLRNRCTPWILPFSTEHHQLMIHGWCRFHLPRLYGRSFCAWSAGNDYLFLFTVHFIVRMMPPFSRRRPWILQGDQNGAATGTSAVNGPKQWPFTPILNRIIWAAAVPVIGKSLPFV